MNKLAMSACFRLIWRLIADFRVKVSGQQGHKQDLSPLCVMAVKKSRGILVSYTKWPPGCTLHPKLCSFFYQANAHSQCKAFGMGITVPKACFERLQDMEKLKASFSCRKRNFSFRGLTVVQPRLVAEAGHSDQGMGEFLLRHGECMQFFNVQDDAQNWPQDTFLWVRPQPWP